MFTRSYKNLNTLVRFNIFEQRNIPLKINKDIKTIPGYLLVDFSSEVDSVFVSGPKTLLDALLEVVYSNSIKLKHNIVKQKKDLLTTQVQFQPL